MIFIIPNRALLIVALIFVSTTRNVNAENEHFAIRGQYMVSYDDNVTFASTNEINDLVQRALLGLDIKADTSRNQFLAQADIYRNFYLDNSSFDNTAVTLRMKDTFEVSQRLRFSASDSYQRSEDPSSFDDEFGRSGGRYRTDRNQFDLQMDLDVTAFTIFQWTYGHEYTGYSREDLDDTDMHHTGARAEYAFDEANRVGAGYEYSRRFFETGSELTGHMIFADYGHNFTRQLSLNLKVGQDFIDNDVTGSARQARYEVSLMNDIDATTRGGLKYTKGLSDYAYSQDLFDSYRFSFTLARELNSRISVNGGGFWGEGEYKQSRIRDSLAGIGVGAEYALTKNASFGANYSYSETDSNQNTRSYQRNVITVLTKVKF